MVGRSRQKDSLLTYQPRCYWTLSPRALVLFDIDGVIRDVGGSYRRALSETVHHYSGYRPTAAEIDALKGEGLWNNDWEACLELLRRRGTVSPLPTFDDIVAVFSEAYFGGDPDGDPATWKGFIGNEPLLVPSEFFNSLTDSGFAWGFVSGAEPPSCRYVLEKRLGLVDPPLIAMGDAPDKPNPQGILRLAALLMGRHEAPDLGPLAPPVAYLGDTVTDVFTLQRARQEVPEQRWRALAVAPPHLHGAEAQAARGGYEDQLLRAGAEGILATTAAVIEAMEAWLVEIEQV
jgi:HAD superfamily phosphatase